MRVIYHGLTVLGQKLQLDPDLEIREGGRYSQEFFGPLVFYTLVPWVLALVQKWGGQAPLLDKATINFKDWSIMWNLFGQFQSIVTHSGQYLRITHAGQKLVHGYPYWPRVTHTDHYWSTVTHIGKVHCSHLNNIGPLANPYWPIL